ncbi:hypothetical protein E4U53_003668, partial [Claviceps sorghi]
MSSASASEAETTSGVSGRRRGADVDGHRSGWGFFAGPGPLLFANEGSDARDHCANERTFLSHLRLSIFMAVLSLAITLSFHLTHQPTDLERRMAKPLGATFWALSLLMLVLGLANYIRAFSPAPRLPETLTMRRNGQQVSTQDRHCPDGVEDAA